MTIEPSSVSVGLEQRHDRVGDERVERLDVVRHAADEHAGRPALVEADRHRLQVGEDLRWRRSCSARWPTQPVR